MLCKVFYRNVLLKFKFCVGLQVHVLVIVAKCTKVFKALSLAQHSKFSFLKLQVHYNYNIRAELFPYIFPPSSLLRSWSKMFCLCKITLITDVLAYRSMHVKRAIFFLIMIPNTWWNEITGLIYVLRYMHQSSVDTGLLSSALCFCLLVINDIYFSKNYISQVAEIFRVVACRIHACIKLNNMNALCATQTLDIYDVTEIHIHVTFKESL